MPGWPNKLDHLALPVSDLQSAKAFYGAALAPLGMQLLGESESHAAFGISPMPYLSLQRSAVPPAPVHLALVADSREEVDAFYAAALAADARDNGPPGLRPQYHEHYYAAFVLDPDGHNIEAVIHTSPT